MLKVNENERKEIYLINFLDETLLNQEAVRSTQCCYLYALYIQMLTTRTQSQAKAVFRSFLQV